MANQSLIDVCASFIAGGPPPDPRCGVPCRAAAIKLSRHSRSLGLPTSPWVVGALKGRLRALCDSASLR